MRDVDACRGALCASQRNTLLASRCASEWRRQQSRARCPAAISRSWCWGANLRDAPDALVVENPTRGLDFQATAAVQAALRDARDAGAAVVLYSSDLDEVLLLADRVYAMYDGATDCRSHTDRDAVGRAMLGGA